MSDDAFSLGHATTIVVLGGYGYSCVFFMADEALLPEA